MLGLRKGEVLGLTWELVDLEAGELYVGEQLQRVGRQLLRRETKTESSEAPLPLPGICVAALKLRKSGRLVKDLLPYWRAWPRIARLKGPLTCVGDTGIEPVTSSV